MAENYKISLGIDFDDSELSNIKKQLTNLTDNTHRLRVDIDNSRLLKQIEHAKKELKELNKTSGNKPSLTLNTTSLEKSLEKVSKSLDDIKNSFGTIGDDKSGVKNLLSSINQIANALGKVESESESLITTLKTLSSKDFSVNLGINMGGSNSVSRQAAYGNKARNETLPQLKKQADAMTDYLQKYYNASADLNAVFALIQKTYDDFNIKTRKQSDVISLKNIMGDSTNSLAAQMNAYKQYIEIIEEAIHLTNSKDLKDGMARITSGFSKSADDLIKDAQNVQTGAKEMEDSFEKLKQVFGGGKLDVADISTQLEPIINKLGEIKTAIEDLSKVDFLSGLTASFDRLSKTLENLTSNLTLAKNTLDTGLSNTAPVNNVVKTAQQTGQKIGEAVGKSATQSAKQSINLDDVIDEQVLKLMSEYAIVGNKGSKAFDEIRQSLVDFRNGSGDINKVTSAISNNMKVVNEAKNDYKDLADYIRMFNASGAKVHIPDSIRQEYGDDYKSMRSQLGKGFTSGQGMDFETFVVELNSILGQTIDLSHGAEAAFGDLVNKVNSTKGGKFLTGDDLFKNGVLDMGDVVANVSTSLEQIENAEEEMARTSTAIANTVVQNEERKQQAYQETAREFLAVQKGSFQRVFSPTDKEFGGINNTAKSVEEYFKSINGVLADTVSVQERFDADKNLSGFTVSLKNANGAAEQLRYTLRTIEDTGDAFFEYTGGSVNDNGVLKQMSAISAKADTLQNKLDKLKSSYSDQNVSRPIKDDSHIIALSEQYDKVEKAIIGVRNADESTFASMVSNAQREITTLETMVSEFKNAENVASKMKSTDFASALDIAKNDLEKFKAQAKDFPQITKTIEDLNKAIERVGDASSLNKFNDQLRVARSELAKIKSEASAANRSEKVGINVSGLESKIADLQRISPEIDKFEAEIDGAKVSVQSLLADLRQVNTQSDFSVVNSKWKAFTDAAKAAGIAVTETATKLKSASDIKLDIELGTYDNQMSQMYERFDKLSGASDELRNSITKVENAYREMELAAGTGDEIVDTERLIQAQQDYARALEKTNNLIKIQARAEATANRDKKLAQSKEAIALDTDNWLKENTKAVKRYGDELKELLVLLDKAKDQAAVNNIASQIDIVKKKAKNTGDIGLTLWDKLTAKVKEYSVYLSAADVFMYAEQAMREMFNTVLEIDTAMTGLYRVTDLTASQYDNLFNDMISSAKEYGATLNDIINATTDWVRAGFDADTALGLAEVTTMYQHISDLDYDTAAENLITAYNGFKDELNNAFNGDQVAAVEYIADIFNELDNNFAVTSAGLGEALTRSASALDLAGNSIQETAGMITGIVEVTQDPEKAGSALKVLSLRLRGMKGQLEELGEETDENVENISKMQGQILNMTKGKVNIFDGAGNFKSTYEIMKGIADVWDELSSIDQANLLETIAGKNRANDVAALLSNWQNVEEAVKSASAAEGSAAKENAKYVDSLQGRLDKLTTAWQSFANTFMESDFLKGAVSGLTDLVEIVEKLVDTLGSIGTIGLGAGIYGLFKNKSVLSSSFSLAGKWFENIISSTDTLGGKFKNLGRLAKTTGGDIAKGLTGSLFGTIGMIGLVVSAIGLLYNAYKNAKEAAAEARQEMINASNEYLEASSSFEQAYIKYSGRTDLTAEEESELESAINGTVDALGEKSDALKTVVNGSNDYLASLERIADAEIEAAKRAAKAKRDAAEGELKEAAIGWGKLDGSEVDISLATNSKEHNVAKELGTKFLVNKPVVADEYGNTIDTFEIELSANADTSEIIEYYNFLLDYQEKLSDADLSDTSTYEKVTAAIDKMSESIKLYVDGTYEAVKANYQLSEGIPKTVDEYISMREAILRDVEISGLPFDTKMSVLNSLDSEYGQMFDLSSAEVQARKFVGLIKGYGDGTVDGTDEIGTVETFLNMRTAVNNNECTVGQYLSELDNITSMSEKFSDEEKEEFNLAFGLNADSIKKQYEDAYNYIARNYLTKLNTVGMSGFDAAEYKAHEAEKIKDLLGGLSATELQAIANIKGEINWKTTNIEDIRKQIKEEAKFLEAMNYTIAIDVETESLDALNSAMAESVSGAGLSSESIAALKGRYAELASQGYDLSAMFEETSNGIHLNKNAVSEFEQALASQKLSEIGDENSGALGVLKKRYDELTDEINNCTDAGERAHLYSEQQEVAQKINDLATLASQYKGLTSAYNAWQNAESAGQERDMYESIIEGFENIGDEISRGWYDDGTIKFLELMTGKTDLAGKSASELKKIWKGLDDTIKGTSYSVRDFFTTDEDGNSTSTGAYNFLRAVEELGKNGEFKFENGKTLNDLVTRKDGKEDGAIVAFDFGVVGGDKAIAEALGVSEEMVQIIQRTLDDAGFVVTLDGKYTLLADLKTSAEESNNALKKLQSEGLKNLKDLDLNFDFDVNTVEGYQKQLEKALNVLDKFRNKDGTLQTDKNGNLVKGAKEALEIAEYYTAAMDKLTEPKFMQIDTSTVDSELQDPIEKIQTIGDLCKEKHLVALTGDTKELDKVQGEINKVAKEIEELDPEVKAQIGIDDSWDAKTIADKIEKGEIEIPAELKLDVQMSEDLKDMRLLMMRQLGLVSEEEVKLKVGYEIDESTVDNLTPDEQKVAVEFISKNEDWFDKLTDDEKKVAIELVTSGVDLDSLTDDEKKEVVVEFVTKNEDEFDKLSDEEKQVVVDLVTDDSALKSLEEHGVEIEAFCRIFGVEKVDDLKAKLEQLDDEQILVLAEVLGRVDVEKLKTTVAGLDDKTVEAIAKALGEGDVNGLKTVINGLDDKTVQAIAEAFGYSGVDELNKAIENLDPKTVQAIAEALGITDVDSLRNAINRLTNKDVEAAATVSGKDDVNSLKSAIDNLKGKTITVWASIKKKASNLWDKLTGGGGVDGTAHVNGTAFANGTVVKKSGKAFKQGDWGTKDSGIALGGEEAPELLVRNGRWHLIGEKGAEFFGYRKGDIIFNASQTKEIFEKGKITHGNGRGKALVSGTAFSSGSGGGEEITIGVNKNTGASYTKSTDKDDFEETIDWIETAIDRIERAIGQLDTKANSTYRSWSERNGNLAKQISKVGDEIALQQSAYEEYMAAANAVGLSSSWAKKVREGKVDISTVKDETLAEKIKDYQNWYNKALDCKDAILKLKETESSLYAQRFENVQTQYDSILQGYEHTEAMLNEYISQAEAQGHIISKKYYQALINNEKSNISTLKQEQADLIKARDDAVANGEIERGSEEWYKQCAAIDSVTQAIEKGETAILEYAKSMKEIDWDTFDMKQQHISDVTDESDFLIDLMSNKDLHDDKGKLTAQGAATLGLHGLNHNTYMYQADDYAKEIADIDRRTKLDKNDEDYLDPNSKDVINRRRELVGLQRESILAAEDEKQAIKDLVQDGINKELDALQELIDKKNEELESAKDLYEYQKKVKKQTEEIASLEKQMAAYSGDDSEESKAKIQELKVSLEDAKENLKETEWDKYIQDTSALLDTLYTEYETTLNTRLDNVNDLLSQVITGINAGMGNEGAIATALSSGGAIAQSIMNAMGKNGSMKTILNTEANNVGTTLSTAMNNIWSVGEGNAKSVLTTYGDGFQSKQTTTNTTLSGIKASVDAMVDDVDKEAQKKTTANKTTTSAKKNPTKTTATTNKNTTTTQKKTTTNKKSSGDGKPKIGDKVKFVSGQYYYDSQGKKPLGSKYKGKQVYITNINTRDWATHGYHISTGNKLGKGDLGWLKLNQISGYAAGKKNFLNDEIAWTQENGREFIIRPSDGAILTPVAKGDSVLNAAASGNIWSMANNPAEFIKNNLGLDSANVPSGANVQNSCIQNFENITFSMPNVRNYEQLVSEMQKDPKFEKLILAMTVDQIAGKSKLSKNKVIR